MASTRNQPTIVGNRNQQPLYPAQEKSSDGKMVKIIAIVLIACVFLGLGIWLALAGINHSWPFTNGTQHKSMIHQFKSEITLNGKSCVFSLKEKDMTVKHSGNELEIHFIDQSSKNQTINACVTPSESKEIFAVRQEIRKGQDNKESVSGFEKKLNALYRPILVRNGINFDATGKGFHSSLPTQMPQKPSGSTISEPSLTNPPSTQMIPTKSENVPMAEKQITHPQAVVDTENAPKSEYQSKVTETDESTIQSESSAHSAIPPEIIPEPERTATENDQESQESGDPFGVGHVDGNSGENPASSMESHHDSGIPVDGAEGKPIESLDSNDEPGIPVPSHSEDSETNKDDDSNHSSDAHSAHSEISHSSGDSVSGHSSEQGFKKLNKNQKFDQLKRALPNHLQGVDRGVLFKIIKDNKEASLETLKDLAMEETEKRNQNKGKKKGKKPGKKGGKKAAKKHGKKKM